MRWDLESRKLEYDNSNGHSNGPQISFEQELENLKTILSKPEATKEQVRFRKRILIMALGILALAGLFFTYYLQYSDKL